MPETTRKIAQEEHFLAPEIKPYFETTAVNISPELFGRAHDALWHFGDRRLKFEDAAGIDISVLSLAGPGVQVERDTAVAFRRAKEYNGFLAEKMPDPSRSSGDWPICPCRIRRCMRRTGTLHDRAWLPRSNDQWPNQRGLSGRRPALAILGTGRNSRCPDSHPPR